MDFGNNGIIAQMKIDGVRIKNEIGEKLQQEITERNLKPSLGILCVGHDPASHTFVNVKKKFGEKFGFVVDVVFLSEEVSLENVKENLKNIQDRNTSAILQLPLPEKFKNFTEEILEILEDKKDVDVLNPKNSFHTSPIIESFQKVIDISNTGNKRKIAIVGLGQVVGNPLKNYCLQNGYDVTEIKKDEYDNLKNADIIVSAVGSAKLIKKENIKDGSVLIDYGCSYVDGKAVGDFDQECFTKADFYTPVPGGMGPLVVACLFENVMNSIDK